MGRSSFRSFKVLDGCEGHDDAGLHVEDAGAPEAAIFFAPGHSRERSHGPDGVEVAEEQDGLSGGTRGAEAELEDVAEGFLFVTFDAAAEGAGDVFYLGDGGVYGDAVFSGGLGLDEGLKNGAEPLLTRLYAGLDRGCVKGESGGHGRML